MKPASNPTARFFLAILCAGLAGCAGRGMVTRLINGYAEVAHRGADRSDPETTRIALQYQDPTGRHYTVWPSLYGVNEVIRGNTVLFVADKAYVSSNPNDARGMKARLFAVTAPGLPLDITDEILQRWSATSGKDFAKASELIDLVKPEENNGRLEFYLFFETDERDDWPDAVMPLDWAQVTDIMREVKAKGTVHKDLRWGSPYIEK